jgi:predicted nucleic acid-binding protein
VIFVDSNVPMYLVGGEHRHKTDSQLILERLIVRQQRLVTDAEVLQEILHRFSSIRRLDAIGRSIDVLYRYVDVVLPVTGEDVLAARDILLTTPELSARDALHAAVMRHHEITQILSFDRGFDLVEGITRISR